jgi:hypothetical protein
VTDRVHLIPLWHEKKRGNTAVNFYTYIQVQVIIIYICSSTLLFANMAILNQIVRDIICLRPYMHTG